MSWYLQYQLQQQAQQQAQKAQQAVQASVTPPKPTVPSPLPPENPVVVQDRGRVYVNTNYNTTPVTAHTVSNPLEKRVVAYQITRKEEPKQVQPTQQRATPTLLGGTGIVGLERPTFGNPLQKGQVLLNTPEAKGYALDVLTLAIPVGGAIKTISKLGVTGIKTILPTAAKTVVKQSALGAGFSVGFSQVAKGVQGGGLLTPTEVVESAAVGAVLAPVGSKTVQVLKLAGRGVAPALGRIGVNTVIGGGVSAGFEYAQTGQVTPENVALGAATGAAFGAASEVGGMLNTKYRVTERVGGKVQDVAIKKNLSNLEQIDTRYQEAYDSNVLYRPTFKEKVVMKTTGMYPIKLGATNIEMLPTIATSNVPDAQSPDMGVSVKSTNRSILPETAIGREKFVGSIKLERGEVLKIKNQIAADFDSGYTLFGKSLSPEEFYAKSFAETKTPASMPDDPGLKLLEQKIVKSNFTPSKGIKRTDAEIFETARNVDRILDDLNLNIKPSVNVPSPRKSDSFVYRGKQTAPQPEVQTQPEILSSKTSSKLYRDPAEFIEAEAMLQRQTLENTKLVAKQELIKTSSTVGERSAVDIMEQRIPDTARRPVNLDYAPYAGYSWGMKTKTIQVDAFSEQQVSTPATQNEYAPYAGTSWFTRTNKGSSRTIGEQTVRNIQEQRIPDTARRPSQRRSVYFVGARSFASQQDAAGALKSSNIVKIASVDDPSRTTELVLRTSPSAISTTKTATSRILEPQPIPVRDEIFVPVTKPSNVVPRGNSMYFPSYPGGQFEGGGLSLPKPSKKAGVRSSKRTTSQLVGFELLGAKTKSGGALSEFY